jgi:cytochrome c
MEAGGKFCGKKLLSVFMYGGEHRTRATIVVLLIIVGPGCRQPSAAIEPGSDPKQGAILLSAHGCGSCHTIPGVSGADGTIGPPLTGYARRGYVAGKLPNQLDNLMRWIRDPQSIEPETAMPKLPVNQAEARAMAAYLYTLR